MEIDPMDDGLNALWIKLFLFSKCALTEEKGEPHGIRIYM